MDAECGDGDFGSAMFIAFSSVRTALDRAQSNDIGVLLKEVGNAILASAGGASGPMFGTLFIEAGKAAKGKKSVELSDLAMILDQALQQIHARGRAIVGDKTLVDALDPAVNYLKGAAASMTPLPLALENAAQAAISGCESTKQLTAKHGKARYLGDQTLGFADPGAQVIALLFSTLADCAKA
jgi:dihydroxyacetone kinase-like protein